METWITSDGRAYFVQLHESESEGESSTSELVEDEQVCELSLSVCIFLFIHAVALSPLVLALPLMMHPASILPRRMEVIGTGPVCTTFRLLDGCKSNAV